MLQLKNSSPFAPAIALFPDEEGVDTLYLVIRGTFALNGGLSLAEQQLPPVPADEYWGEPGASSLKYASDMHLKKPSTDVVLVGQAWGKDGQAVDRVDVGIAVGERRKLTRVFGDRTWRKDGQSFTPPEPFESLPLVYERAFGGIHEADPEQGLVLAEEHNPVGLGFRGQREESEAEGRPLPNIEDPQDLIESWGDAPAPQGFGFVAPAWQPRRDHAGTYDEAWQAGRAPYLPEDFDSRFFNSAHPDLICDGFLQGGEPIQVVGATPRGRLKFRLPICDFDVKVRIAGRVETPPLDLETVLIEPEEDRLSLVWRAAVPCDKTALKVEQIDVGFHKLNLSGVA